MRIFVTGGTGFTGSQAVSLLLKNGYPIRCLHRPTSDRAHLLHAYPEIEWVEGDVSETDTLTAAMTGMDALLNMVSLGFDQVDSILRAARSAGIRRAIFISTTAIFTRLNAESKNIRLAAEQSIRDSGLQYTILRPTMIYGSPRDRNMWRLIRWMRISPVVPVFGNGKYLQQPVYVEDAARAVVSCMLQDRTIHKTYTIAGKAPLTYNQVIDTIAEQLKKRVWKLHIPSRLVVAVLAALERLGSHPPIKAEQVLRLNEDKNFSYEDAWRDFGFSPLSFAEGIALELQGK